MCAEHGSQLFDIASPVLLQLVTEAFHSPAQTLAHVQLSVLPITLIETDVVEVAGGEFITLSMKAAAQMGWDLLSNVLL